MHPEHLWAVVLWCTVFSVIIVLSFAAEYAREDKWAESVVLFGCAAAILGLGASLVLAAIR